jgi:putative flippase GtrA
MNSGLRVLIVIPSLEPNDKLLLLLKSLRVHLAEQPDIHADILLVDDGSGANYAGLFEEAQRQYGCTLLRHAVNLGKGRALKTAFNYFLNEFRDYSGVVTADSDGQHTPEDIIRCIRMLSCSGSLILGCRNFDVKDVPFKSRFGNKITRKLFSFLCGVNLSDTQTGLRAIPAELLPLMLAIPGERFEYEMNMLIECGNRDIAIAEVPIETIYSENNKGTHFNPLFDSLKIYATFLKYVASSLSTSLLDFFVFYIATELNASLAISITVSRGCSAIYNFAVNRNIVFNSNKQIYISLFKYIILVVVSGMISFYALSFLNNYFHLLVSKILVETVLFSVNYYIQRSKIFD